MSKKLYAVGFKVTASGQIAVEGDSEKAVREEWARSKIPAQVLLNAAAGGGGVERATLQYVNRISGPERPSPDWKVGEDADVQPEWATWRAALYKLVARIAGNAAATSVQGPEALLKVALSALEKASTGPTEVSDRMQGLLIQEQRAHRTLREQVDEALRRSVHWGAKLHDELRRAFGR